MGVGDHPIRITRQSKNSLRRRAEAGQLEATLIGEASLLHDWARAEFPGQEPPVPESIAIRISDLYHALRDAQQN